MNDMKAVLLKLYVLFVLCLPAVLALGLFLALTTWHLSLDLRLAGTILLLWLGASAARWRHIAIFLYLTLYLVLLYGTFWLLNRLGVPIWLDFFVFANVLLAIGIMPAYYEYRDWGYVYDGIWSNELLFVGPLLGLGTLTVLGNISVWWALAAGIFVFVTCNLLLDKLSRYDKMQDLLIMILLAIGIPCIIRLLSPIMPDAAANAIAAMLQGGWEEPLTPQLISQWLHALGHLWSWISPVGTVMLAMIIVLQATAWLMQNFHKLRQVCKF